MELKDFFFENTYTIKWDYVWSLPHFCEMEKTEQNPRWHMEGNVKEHTILVVGHMYNWVESHFSEVSLERKRLLVLAALFHDIGKPKTTFKGEKDGNWHSYGHDSEGEKIAREMLWDWPLYQREYICNMVKYHMSPLFFRKQKDPEMAIRKMVSILPVHDLYFLKMSDLYGALQHPEYSTKEEDIKILEEFLEIGKKWANVYLPFTFNAFRRDDNKGFTLTFFAQDDNLKDFNTNRSLGSKSPIIYVLIGFPGSGKNTMIENSSLKEHVVLSRDDIRVELGYCSEGEKIVGTDKQEKNVTKIFDSRMETALLEGKDVVINNINLSKKRRKALKHQWEKYHPIWRYIYIEAPTFQDNINRRKGQISEKVFKDMISRFDFPDIFECDYLTIVKQ